MGPCVFIVRETHYGIFQGESVKPRHEPLQPGRLQFDAHGIPANEHYGDVYHARAGALAQARHVFLQGNDLPQRWCGQDGFTVCETGFGLGNNFLALWEAWRHAPARPRRLHVLSFEAHPLTRQDLARALAGHTGEMRQMAEALVAAWPPLLPGLHRLEFEQGRLTLTLAFGKVEHLARQVEARVDAFFLDGFSPARNPAMWSRELFGQMVRIAVPGATAATWCSAGQVRRDLAAAGFLVTRVPGFGGKRQVSRAVLRPGLGRPAFRSSGKPVMVVGGGLAGAGVAHSLALRGHPVTVIDPVLEKGSAGSHEGHPCAAMTPALSRDDNAMSRLSRAGILLAHLRWQEMPQVAQQCGSLMRIDSTEMHLWRDSLARWQYPDEWMSWCEAEDTVTHAGVPLSSAAIWLPRGALVRPPRLLDALLAHERIELCAGKVMDLRRIDNGWQALNEEGAVLAEASTVILAAAADTPSLLQGAFPQYVFPKLTNMQLMGGQVGFFRAGAVPAGRSIVAGAGYWLPADGGLHVGGSTYEFDQPTIAPTEAGLRAVANKVAGLLEVRPERLLAGRADSIGWAGCRAAVSDHLPVIGPVDEQKTLWVACAYGSRGLSWMTLAGEIMACGLNNEPQVVERELLKAVRPR